MADIHTIDPVAHADQGFAPSPDYLHSRAIDRVPLLIAEVPMALMIYPLAFSEEPEGLRLVAVLGGQRGQNDCLGEGGRWRTGYIPSALRAYPFAPVSGGNGDLAVGFDHDSGLWREAPDPARGEKRFFDADGTPGSILQHAETLLRKCTANQAITDAATAELGKAEVLVPWHFPEAISGGDPPEGLFRIDQKALHALPPKALAHLMQSNALALAHAQVFSLPRLSILAGLREVDTARDDTTASALFGGDEGNYNFLLD